MRMILKATVILVSLAAVLLLAVWYFVAVPVMTEAVVREGMASSERLRQHVVVLSDQIGARPHNRPDKLNEAAAYIFENFGSFGNPSYQDYAVKGQTYRNVVLRLKGNQYCEDKLYVVGAHYDTHLNNPGADDNASGVAGLIELARAIKQRPLPCDVELVAYSLEEPPNFRTPNMGSFHHARSLAQSGWPFVRMISLEMIGYFSDAPKSQHYPVPALRHLYGDRGDFIGIVGDLKSRALIRKVKRSFVATGRIKTKAISAPSFVEGIDFSDHQNYLKFGIPAIMVTDTAYFRNANYHRPSDTYDTLNYGKMSAVVDSVYYALKDMIGAPPP